MTGAHRALDDMAPDADSIRSACVLRDVAHAKVNLTLEVRGRRADGYHELESLVAFTAFGDDLALRPGPGLGAGQGVALDVSGPFASAIEGANLIGKAAELFAAAGHAVDAGGGAFALEKRVPVAAGLGGGSADAAAALRLLARHARAGTRVDPGGAETHIFAQPAARLNALAGLQEIAARIGADVPACLFSAPAIMTGVGERLRFLMAFPSIPILLINPRLPLATADVFRELRARAMETAPSPVDPDAAPGALNSLDAVLNYAVPRRNDLEAPARRLLPVIGAMIDALAACPGALLARLSGSGPTCFALFRADAEVEDAAARIARMHPGWWVQASRLMGG